MVRAGGWTVLHVEDDLGERRLLEATLRRADLDVELLTAGSVEAATQTLAEASADVVLLDLGLPDSQGLATLTSVQEAAPDTPVVVLTGQDDTEGIGVEVLRLGAQDFLVKGSFAPGDLRRALRFAVERGQLRLQLQALATIDAAGRIVQDVEAFLRLAVAETVAAAPQLGLYVTAVVQERRFAAGAPPPPNAVGVRELDLHDAPGMTGQLLAWRLPPQEPLSTVEETFVRRVRDLVAGSLHGLVANSSLSHRNRELWAISGVAEALHRTRDPQQLADEVAAALSGAFEDDHAVDVRVELPGAPPDQRGGGDPTAPVHAAIVVDGATVGHIEVRGMQAASPWARLLLDRTADLLATWTIAQQAESERAREAHRLAFLTETTPTGVVFVDREGRITYANPEAMRIFGVPPDSTLDRTFDDPDFRTETVEGDPLPPADTPFAQVRETLEPVRDVTHAIWTPDDQRRIIAVNASPILDTHGAFDGMVAAVADVTDRESAHRQLAESRARLRMVLSQLPAVAWTVNRDLEFTSINGAGMAALAPPPQVGDDFAAYFGRGLDFLPVAVHRAALEGETSTYGFWWDDAWWRVAVEPLRNDDEEIVGAVGIGLDATAEKRAVAQAARQQARYRSLFERSTDAIVLIDDEGAYIDVNPAAEVLLGRSAAELIGATVDDQPGLDPQQARDLRAHRTKLQQEGDTEGVLAIADADGNVLEVEYRATADVQPGVHMAIIRDVTEQRRSQRRLAASEEQFRTLAEAAAEGIIRVRIHPARRVEYVNPALERITGLSSQQVIDDPDLLLQRIQADDRADFLAAPTEPRSVRFQHADGQWRWLQLHQTDIRDEHGRAFAVVAVIRDITEQRRHQEALTAALEREHSAAQQLRELDELKNGFLRAVSHELRTPLTAVYGLAATIHDRQDELAGPQVHELASRLMTNAERLRELLTDLLDIGRLTRGQITPEREPLDLADLARAVAEAASLHDRTLLYDLTPTPATVEPATTRRVIHNLLMNAERHTRPGSTIRLRTHPDADGAAHLIVEDNGPGLPEGLGDAIFDPFVQGPDAASSPQPGTGVGLSLVRQFVMLHDGTVDASNRPEGGARFHVVLPPQPVPSPADTG